MEETSQPWKLQSSLFKFSSDHYARKRAFPKSKLFAIHCIKFHICPLLIKVQASTMLCMKSKVNIASPKQVLSPEHLQSGSCLLLRFLCLLQKQKAEYEKPDSFSTPGPFTYNLIAFLMLIMTH